MFVLKLVQAMGDDFAISFVAWNKFVLLWRASISKNTPRTKFNGLCRAIDIGTHTLDLLPGNSVLELVRWDSL